MGFAPTPEQAAALDAFATRGNLVIEAAAGAGKTSTLKLLAASTAGRGIYFAYNRDIAQEAARTFPKSVLCKTLHALAYRDTARARPYLRERLDLPRQNAREVAEILGISGPTRISEEVVLAPAQLANIAMETVARFARSGDDHVTRTHMPHRAGIETPESRARLAEAVGAHARIAWTDLCSPRGRLRADHDHYRKMWALTNPRLPADYLLVDEAQDSDGLTMQLIANQARAGAQIITVGDPNQAIYGWRGAESAMDAFGGTRLRLTQSFRFGPAIAAEANVWLRALGSTMRVRGTETIASRVCTLPSSMTNAILCRSNARAIETLMELNDEGVRAHVVGGGADMLRLAEAAKQLAETGTTWHPELAAFSTWEQVQDYVENDAGGSDLAAAVKMIDTWGPGRIIHAVRAMAHKKDAQVMISTAHKSKGLEWNNVAIAGDFPGPEGEDGDIDPSEAMLAYVAVTRAKQRLDNAGLAWIHQNQRLASAGRPRPTAA